MSGVQSIERGFAVLRALVGGPLGVTEIADRTDLPKSTVSRLLSALEAERAVEQVETGGGYAIGTGLAALAAAGDPQANLVALVRPHVEELAARTGGSAGFTSLDGDEVFWVDNVDDGDELVTIVDQTGQSFPLHGVASGLALLAHFDDDRLARYLDLPLVALHEGSVTDPAVLRRWVEDARSDGVVISRERLDPGVTSLATAFRGLEGRWEHALYVQGPSFRFPQDGDEAGVVAALTLAAERLSGRLASI
ncbi:IclR family transcriptional regulator [Ilumatobacter sp.]|uniref:IclR family transcriptional regulator n=1 Tax=Ilumatobacter sp. TaxID=1967498 RepID=UPI003B516AA4